MNKIDLEKLNDIIKFNESLEKIYETLAQLEIDGKTDTQEYQDNISYAKLVVEVIKKKLKSLTATPEEIIDFEKTIGKLNRLNENNHDILVDILELSTNNKMRRLCMQIYYYSLKNGSYIIEDEYVDESFDKEIIDEYIDESFMHEDEIEYLKDKLIANTFMDYLLDAIKEEKDLEIKNELIKIKYRVIYLYEHLEAIFLNDQINFTKTPIIQELFNLKVEENDCDLEEIYIDPVDETIKAELKYLSELNEDYYNSKKNVVRAILRTLYIKTYLSINISKVSINNLDKYKKSIKPKSENSKQYIENAYKLKKELTTLKKVDF